MKILRRSAIAAFVLFAIGFSYLFQKHGHVLVYLWDFPRPTEMRPIIPVYNLEKFGKAVSAGYSKKDITPGLFSWVAGFMPPHPGLSIKDRLWVKSLALEDGSGESVVFVSCDLIGLLPDELDKIFSMVKNIQRERIFISTTHTHSGPDTMGLWGGKNKKYMAKLRKAIAEAIDESVADMGRSSIRFGRGKLEGYAHGREENPADPSVNVIQVLKGNQLITLVNFACHPDVVQGLQISADFPYFLSERLRMRIGSEVMFIPGAIGGVQPSNDRKVGPYFVRTIGEDLADAVVSIMRKPEIPKSSRIWIRKQVMLSPFENQSDLKMAVDLGLVSNLRDKDGNVFAEANRIDIGHMSILTVPGELFPKIWWKVKKADGNTMIFGLTNGEFGYILLPDDYNSGKHRYHSSISIGPTFGSRMLQSLKELMED